MSLRARLLCLSLLCYGQGGCRLNSTGSTIFQAEGEAGLALHFCGG